MTQLAPSTFIDAHAVAQMIGMDTGAAFLRARPRLEDETAFPLPMPAPLRPLKWRRDAVQAWIAAQGRPLTPGFDQAAARHAGPNVILMDAAGRA